MTDIDTADHDFDDFDAFAAAQRAHFADVTRERALFTTDVDRDAMWQRYLGHFPDESRQSYNCHACRRFIQKYGGLVVIDESGRSHPALWLDTAAATAPGHLGAAAALRSLVDSASVDGVLLSSEPTWGKPVTGEWRHMAVTNPQLRERGRDTDGQLMAAKRQDFGTLSRALAEFSLDASRQAVTLLEGGQLYRSERGLPAAQWLLALQQRRASAAGPAAVHNITWQAVAAAPPGFCNVRSSVIGTLLQDIVEGKSFQAIQGAWQAKLDPSQYQRAQVAPSAGSIAQAEKLFAELGLAPALARRYAARADIPAAVYVWQPAPLKTASTSANGLFSHITPKSAKRPAGIETPPTVMTWAKFQRVVLPKAITIEARVPADSRRFMALVTAAENNAPPILQWDHEKQRNPVSWYYHGGIDSEMRRRVMAAGGQYDDVDIRATLMWNNRNDLDVHIMTPAGEHIYYANKQAGCGGWLDVDMNVRGETTTPVENIRWQQGAARPGHYRVFVRNYKFHERDRSPTRFSVELEVAGQTYRHDGVISPRRETGQRSDITVFTFDYRQGAPATVTGGIATGVTQAGTNAWGLTPEHYAPVTGIVPSPNLWTDEQPRHGTHVFFLLQGCADSSEGRGRGLFTETLRADLRPVRSVLEAHLALASIDSGEDAAACGLGFTDSRPWDLTLRVVTGTGVAAYTIDRFD